MGEEISLGLLDIVLFVASITLNVFIGFYFANKNKTIDEFMLGGRQQKLIPVALSMMTSFTSGLTLIGTPSEMYYYGPYFATISLGTLIAVPFSALILLPVFYNLGGISVYSYLGERYHPFVKQVVSVIFMLQMTLYNAVVLYVPSMSLQSVFGISETISIGVVGLSCIIYSTIGGIKAVIWTDFFQAGLMYLSLICIIIYGLMGAGGFGNLVDVAQQGGRLSFADWFKLDLTTRHTIFTITIGATMISVFMNGCNQIQVQRALSLPSLRTAQWSQLLTAVFTALLSLLASFIGLILYHTYKDCDPYESGQIDRKDAILIYHVYHKLVRAPGVRGIFVAGIFAATLSTLSSFQNSMAALMLEDIVRPILVSRKRAHLGDTHYTWLSKLFSLAFGLACIGLTFVVGRINGLLQAALTLFGALGAPFLAAFYLGVLTRFTNTAGILAGMIVGLVFGVYVQLYQMFYMPPLKPTFEMPTRGCPGELFNATETLEESELMEPLEGGASMLLGSISYMWLPVFAFIISALVASVVSLATGGWNQQVDNKYLAKWKHVAMAGKRGWFEGRTSL